MTCYVLRETLSTTHSLTYSLVIGTYIQGPVFEAQRVKAA